MTRTFYTTLILFLLVWSFFAIERHLGGIGKKRLQKEIEFFYLAQNPAIQVQIHEIDRQIQELEDMKRGYEARALRHEDQASRLQFEDRSVLETRRHIELADENRQKAEKVQEEIDRLQTEKQRLLGA